MAAAFRTGTVTTTFRSYATEVTGTNRLQFAEVRQMEVFERRDEAAVLWGTLALPDVVVEARAPVEYTYYLDLDKEWTFRLEGKDVHVVAPPVEFNRPSVDVSALRYEVREGSLLRDEEIALDKLRSELSAAHACGGPASSSRWSGTPVAAASRPSSRPGWSSASPTVATTAPESASPTSRRRQSPRPPALPSPAG